MRGPRLRPGPSFALVASPRTVGTCAPGLQVAREPGTLEAMSSETTRHRVPLKAISSRAWEHPADRGALVALRKLQGFDTILKRFSAFMNERSIRMQLLGSAVRVSEGQFPRVHRLHADAATVLDAPDLPSCT